MKIRTSILWTIAVVIIMLIFTPFILKFYKRAEESSKPAAKIVKVLIEIYYYIFFTLIMVLIVYVLILPLDLLGIAPKHITIR